jgi:hypothetical protein
MHAFCLVAIRVHAMCNEIIKYGRRLIHSVHINFPLSNIDVRSEILQDLPQLRAKVSSLVQVSVRRKATRSIPPISFSGCPISRHRESGLEKPSGKYKK